MVADINISLGVESYASGDPPWKERNNCKDLNASENPCTRSVDPGYAPEPSPDSRFAKLRSTLFTESARITANL